MKFDTRITIEAGTEAEAGVIMAKIEKLLAALPVEFSGVMVPDKKAEAPAGESPTVMVWTDGGCDSKKNGIGAWAYVIKTPDGKTHEHCEGEGETTNNRMELTAVIRALEVLEIGAEIVVHCDSEYVIKGCTQWAKNWVKNGWKTYQGQNVINKDLWEILLALYQLHNVRFVWVKGHSGVVENERCDELCTATMTALYKESLSGGVQ